MKLLCNSLYPSILYHGNFSAFVKIMPSKFEQGHGIGWSQATERYHPTFIEQIAHHFGDERIEISTRAFGNGMPLFLVGSAEHAMLITWVNGDNWQEAISELVMIGSGLTAAPDEAGPNVERLDILSPFADGRQDKRTKKPVPDSTDLAITKKQSVFTNAMAQIMHDVVGARSFITVDFHSYDGAKSITNTGMELVNLTVVPLFADEISRRGLLGDNLETIVGTTDIGDLNRAVPMSRYLNLPLAIVHKKSLTNADGTDREIKQKLIYGDPKGKRVILVDDIISSGKTMREAVELYVALGAKEIILCATHPVFIGDYYKNLQEVLKHSAVKLVLTTNSLPLLDRSSGGASIPYVSTGTNQKRIEVLNTVPLIVNAAYTILHSASITEAKQHLGQNIWDIRDPYELASTITGIPVPKPPVTQIYEGEGIYKPLPSQETIFSGKAT